MSIIKTGFGIFWTLALFTIIYCLLRTITSASNYDFNGYGTLIYFSIAAFYSMITIVLGIFCSKKWFYFLYGLVFGTALAPFLLLFLLSHFPIH